MGQFLESISEVRKNYGKYDEWEQEQADKRAKKEYLSKIINTPKDKIELTKQKAQTVIRATEIMDRYSEDNCEDVEMVTGLATQGIFGVLGLAAFAFSQKIQDVTINKNEEIITALKKSMKKSFYLAAASSILSIAAFAGLSIWSTSKQKEASRIGRFQAMQNDLKDIKNFVVYTPEQLQQAEEKAKLIPDEKEKNDTLDSIKNLRKILHDKDAYEAWQKSKDTEYIEKLKNRKLTNEQIAAGNENKELIVNTVKEINIKAEEYSENLENAFDTIDDVSFLLTVPASWLINKTLKLAGITNGRNVVSIAVPLIAACSIAIYGTMAQKEASRVGRYQARKDLSNNPSYLMTYSNEDMQKARNIKAPEQKKSVWEKISQSFSFVSKYYSDKKEYDEYKKTAYQHQIKLQKAFSDIKISEQQRKDAENLQKKVFLAFEEIDEMSQRYSEDVEAGCDIAKNTINQLLNLVYPAVTLLSGYMLYKGKFPWTKILNTVTNIGFKETSSLRKAINDFYKSLKDNNLVQKFQASPVNFWKTNEAAPVSSAKDNLINKITSIGRSSSVGSPNGLKEGLKQTIQPELKDGHIAKWVRNLFMEGIELYARNKASEFLGKEGMKNLPKSKWSDYKTLIGTAAAAGIPIIGTMVAIPYMLNSFLTDLQKKAGKIGIMKAMEKIDDPKVFADENVIINNQNNNIKNTGIFDTFTNLY